MTNTTNKAMKIYSELPTWAKGTVVVGGLAIGWFAIVRPIVNLVKDKLSNAQKQKESIDANKELKELSKKGVFPTISKTQAEQMSNALRIAFSGCGTDEATVYNVMSQLKNDADAMLLISTYGTRKYIDCPFWSVGFGSGMTSQTLSGAMSDELDSFEKNIVSKILEKNGLTITFY